MTFNSFTDLANLISPTIRHLFLSLHRWLDLVWWVFAFAFLLLISAEALGQVTDGAQHSDKLILERAFWKDSTGHANLAQAQKQSFTPYNEEFTGGYTDSVHWFRLKLASSETPISLRLSPTWLDEITLYDPVTPNHTYRAGDRHPQGSNAQHMLGYVFTLPAHPEPRELWLQLRSSSAHLLTLQSLPADQLTAANNRALAWTALYSAVLLLMLLALLSIWWVQREALLTAYLVRHANYILYGVTYLGLSDLLLFDALAPGVLDKGFSCFVVLTLPLGLWFDIALLKTYKPHPLLVKALQFMAWAGLGVLAMLLAGHTRLALQTTVVSLTFAVPLVFLTAWTTKPEAAIERLIVDADPILTTCAD